MAKLYFRYGAMGSSKTANAIMVQYNYQERGQNALMLKPRLDNRDGARVVGVQLQRGGVEGTACGGGGLAVREDDGAFFVRSAEDAVVEVGGCAGDGLDGGVGVEDGHAVFGAEEVLGGGVAQLG